jgi:hypothetical protein
MIVLLVKRYNGTPYTDVCGDDFNDIVCFSFQFKHERRRSQIFEQTAKAS